MPDKLTHAPMSLSGVEEVILQERWAYLTPGWYVFDISDPGYTPESINSKGATIKANTSWIMTVVEALDPSMSDAVGKRIRDTFWYGAKNDFGMGRLLNAINAIRTKPMTTRQKAQADQDGMDLTPFDGTRVLGRVNDNPWDGNVTTQVQEYRNMAKLPEARASVLKTIEAKAQQRTNGKVAAGVAPKGPTVVDDDEEDAEDQTE